MNLSSLNTLIFYATELFQLQQLWVISGTVNFYKKKSCPGIRLNFVGGFSEFDPVMHFMRDMLYWLLVAGSDDCFSGNYYILRII